MTALNVNIIHVQLAFLAPLNFVLSLAVWDIDPPLKKLCTFFSESKVWQGVFLQIDVFILVETYRDGAQLPSDFTEMHLVASAVLWVCDVLRIYDFEFQ